MLGFHGASVHLRTSFCRVSMTASIVSQVAPRTCVLSPPVSLLISCVVPTSIGGPSSGWSLELLGLPNDAGWAKPIHRIPPRGILRHGWCMVFERGRGPNRVWIYDVHVPSSRSLPRWLTPRFHPHPPPQDGVLPHSSRKMDPAGQASSPAASPSLG